MQIALLRHGIAADHAPTDFARPLTREGREEVAALVDSLAAQGWRPGSILHSPLVRATQTAEIAHARFPGVPRHALDEIAHGDLQAILYVAAGWEDPLLVGHEPTFSRLAARLLGSPPGTIRVDRGSFALFEVDRLPPARPATLLYLSPPRRAQGLASTG